MNDFVLKKKPLEIFSHGELAELNENLQPENLQHDSQQYKSRKYGFLLGGEILFFENTLKREFFEKIEIKKIPLMEKFILGLCNVRGNLVPVYDLAGKYNLESSDKKQESKVLVISYGEDMVGFAMNQMLIPIDFYEEDILETDTSIHTNFSEFIEKSFLINNQTWHQIDHSNLFESLMHIQ